MAEFVDEELIDFLFLPDPDERCRQTLAKARIAAARMRQTTPPKSLLATDGTDGYGELLLDRLAQEPGPPGPHGRAALAAGVRRLEVAELMGDPVNPLLVAQIHAEVSGTRDPQKRGRWRRMGVKTDDMEAIYAPAPRIEALLRRACLAFETVSTDALAGACALACSIEAIHPFVDANSRVARLILALALARGGLPPVAFDTQGLMRRYIVSIQRWIRRDECEPMLSLVATECVHEAETRLVYALL